MSLCEYFYCRDEVLQFICKVCYLILSDVFMLLDLVLYPARTLHELIATISCDASDILLSNGYCLRNTEGIFAGNALQRLATGIFHNQDWRAIVIDKINGTNDIFGI